MKSVVVGGFLAIAAVLSFGFSGATGISLSTKPVSAHDLKLSGELPGVPAGEVRYVAYQDLLKLPQVTFTVTDDPNFSGKTEISGIYLDELLRILAIPDDDTLIAAVCDDAYEAHYTRDYRAAHKPILVLKINGKPLAVSSRTADGGSYGPYLISHASFTPRFHILKQEEGAQIPNGVLELRFLKENEVLDAIRPRGSFAADSPEMQGYQIAQENCFRCHNEGDYGGHKAGRSWSALARIAKADPVGFAAYTKDPQSENAYAAMPANPDFDKATLQALTAYFQTFADQPGSKK